MADEILWLLMKRLFRSLGALKRTDEKRRGSHVNTHQGAAPRPDMLFLSQHVVVL